MSGETPKSEEPRPPAADPVSPHPPGSSTETAPSHSAQRAHGHAHLPRVASEFLDRLKRRNVGRVAILYIVVCYVILEPFEMFFHLLELPAWTGRTVVFLMVLGFPAALLFAWIYEINPAGIKPNAEVDQPQSIARQTGRKLDRAIIVVLAFALVYFVTDKFWISKHQTPAAPAVIAPASPIASTPALPRISDKSVAVLPFVDMSEKKDQEYFSDGLSEELIDLLAHANDLKVIARTSSFQFKGKNEDMRTIGQKLGVANLLEGSVRTSGNTLRVTAQLISVVDGSHRWSQTYERKRGDIFKIQDDITAAVVTALKAKLSSLPAVAEGSRSANVEAYDLYLIGRHLMAVTGIDNFQKAAKSYQSAIALDNKFAAAYVGLADAQYLIWSWNHALTKTRYSTIQAQLDQAIELAPALSDGYSARGVDRLEYPGDLRGAESDLARALELDPNNSVNQRRYGFLKRCLGNIPAAIEYGKKATLSDPLEVFGWMHLSEAYRAAGMYQLAHESIAQAIELNPNSDSLTAEAFEVEFAQGDAKTVLQSAGRIQDPLLRLYYVARAQFSLGHDQESQEALASYLRDSADWSAAWSNVADIYAWRGEKQKALDWLEKVSKSLPRGSLACIRGDPLYASFRAEPRFTALLRGIDAGP
jgi:adenylate cyclase